jgi:hypothetical protein
LPGDVGTVETELEQDALLMFEYPKSAAARSG